jgi:hypothetical protein
VYAYVQNLTVCLVYNYNIRNKPEVCDFNFTITGKNFTNNSNMTAQIGANDTVRWGRTFFFQLPCPCDFGEKQTLENVLYFFPVKNGGNLGICQRYLL